MIIEKKAANAENNGNSIIKVRFLPYLVTPLYTEAPLENPLLFLHNIKRCHSYFKINKNQSIKRKEKKK